MISDREVLGSHWSIRRVLVTQLEEVKEALKAQKTTQAKRYARSESSTQHDEEIF